MLLASLSTSRAFNSTPHLGSPGSSSSAFANALFKLKRTDTAAMQMSTSGTPNTTPITVNNLFDTATFPEAWPFSPRDFSRQDESSDKIFYSSERLVYHIDDKAVAALTKYYASVLTPGASLLDICSSWVSHLPSGVALGRVAGVGMNAGELAKNPQLTDYVARDLNVDPLLPYADNSFDFVTCVVSVDYLTRPLEVFSEIRRVLKPGGVAIFSQSNRCFSTKAINIWLQTSDIQHCFIIGCYFHFAGGFSRPRAIDISPGRFSDPMFIITAQKTN